MIDWDDLRYFLAVQRSGTLARAARILKINATTVGRRLSALEETAGRGVTRHQRAPSPLKTAMSVRQRMWTSVMTEWLSTYERS